jgi:ADP-heptose:LPS heptosyltransferase
VGPLARARRRLTRRYYRALFALARRLFPATGAGGPVDGDALGRVLVMANYFVGDLAVATPALSFLRGAAPRARVDVLVSPRSASLLDGDPRADRVLVHDPRRGGWLGLARRLRRERYDLVVDFVLPHHLREGLLSALVAPRHAARVTPHRPARFAGLFTHRPRVPGFERRYMADRLLYAVRAAFGDRGDRDGRYPPSLAVRPDAATRAAAWLGAHAPGPFVALNAWASDPVRSLGPGLAAAVAAGVAARHPALRVVLTPPPGAEAEAERVAADARAGLGAGAAGRVAVLPPSPRLADLVAALARAALVLTPDTANVHLAAALGRPLVALFTPLGGTRMAHWAPRDVPHRFVVTPGRTPLAELPADAVLAAVDALLDEVGRPEPAGARGPARAAAPGTAAAGTAAPGTAAPAAHAAP